MLAEASQILGTHGIVLRKRDFKSLGKQRQQSFDPQVAVLKVEQLKIKLKQGKLCDETHDLQILIDVL